MLHKIGVIVSAAVLLFLPGCKFGSHDTPTSPGSGSGSGTATFTADAGSRFNGSGPTPLARNGMIYVYQNTGNTGTTVQASADGVNFAQIPASYPAGTSRSIVALQDGRVRMYYFRDSSSQDLLSAVSGDGLNWSTEDGVRFTEPLIVPIRVTALPAGGFRLFFRNGSANLESAFSSDGLAFTGEGQVAGFPLSDGIFGWGDANVIFLNGQFQMVLVRFPGPGGATVPIWHATSADGRNWSVDNAAFVSDPVNNLRNPAPVVNGGVTRLYYGALATGSTNAFIASGIVHF